MFSCYQSLIKELCSDSVGSVIRMYKFNEHVVKMSFDDNDCYMVDDLGDIRYEASELGETIRAGRVQNVIHERVTLEDQDNNACKLMV